MSESIRIRTTPNGGDKYVKVKIDQDIDFVEILSLKISQDELYREFCSDYGVVAGRVIINSGFGVPNAKVSIFIPIDEVDKKNVELSAIYPYETVGDKNSDGIRYNLLPRYSDSENTCFTAVGTFPSKREVLDNSNILEIYCKYYRFTTTTNYAGDFMIFGVPVGTYTLHVDADISDIGIASQRPYDLIRKGSSPKFFNSPTKFKNDTNLNTLIQIKSADVGVNIQPFWGDMENCEIGITRVDVDLNYNLEPCAIFMGSIYGDQDKNSVNKNCIPRKKFGEMCEQVTSAGSIEMIRKTLDDTIEEFSIDGGRVIDDDGTWAYQIPMNLDYMITDETGALILSEDPSKGIPTRANVRFRIGMDETGGLGRLRTRAKYLVPNNPKLPSEIDYNFDENTKPTSFRNLYWNKIYTVSNFITRYQRSITGAADRSITAMKSVDACAGDKNPFPYNRVNTTTNPIFFIICLIIKIIGFIVGLINSIIIPLINAIVSIVRAVVDIINFFGNDVTKPDYVPCVTIECPSDNGSLFAPGCKEGTDGYVAANPTYGCGGTYGDCSPFNLVGLDDCLAFQMAQDLNLFQFDFYNDWVNGTLFSYLLKYKRRQSQEERFCEFDCSDFTGDPNYTGVDGNGDGTPDNDCTNRVLLDTCYNCGGGGLHLPSSSGGFQFNYLDCQKESRDNGLIREGLIKKYKGELYYAATLHTLTPFKLFATEIVCLGSVFTCDWQGYPKLQPNLVTTSYKLPPEIEEKDSNNTTVLASGQVTIGLGSKGLFFDINCVGLHVDYQQCLNLRHICEIGVDLDEAIFIPTTNQFIPADSIMGSNDITDLNEQFRNAFLYINSGTTFPVIYSQPTNINSNFNTSNSAIYNFANNIDNGIDYANFRGYFSLQTPPQPIDNNYWQSKHSFFMYFGIIPGRSALDKMNQRYFTPCIVPVDSDMLIDATVTPATGSTSADGTITFTIVGGQGPYTYVITDNLTGNQPSGCACSGNTINITTTPPSVTVNNLPQGTYTISVFDAAGNPATQTVVVGGPISFYCSASVTQNNTSATSPDGEITFNAIGGTLPYTYSLIDENNNPVSTGQIPSPTSTTVVFNSLPSTSTPQGYTVIVNDFNGAICTTTGLTISGPTVISIIPSVTATTCYYGTLDGAISITIIGAQQPYTVITTGAGPNNSNFYSASLNLTNLAAGNYLITVNDATGQQQSQQVSVGTIGAMLQLNPASASELAKQCDPNNYTIPFYITNGLSNGAIAYIEYRVDNSTTWNYLIAAQTWTTASALMSFDVPSTAFLNTITFRFSDTSNHACHSNTLTYNKASMTLPSSILSKTINNGNNNNGYVQAQGGIPPYTCSINGGQAQPMTGLPATLSFNGTINSVVVTDSVGCTA